MSKYKANIKAEDIKEVLSKETFDSRFFLLFDKYCRWNEVEAVEYIVSINKVSLEHERFFHTLIDLYDRNNHTLIDYLIENTDIHTDNFLVFLLEQKEYNYFKSMLKKHGKLFGFLNSGRFDFIFNYNKEALIVKKSLIF